MKRIGRQVALLYVDGLKTSSTSVIRVAAEDEERAWEILQLYQDQDFSYVDATSFALMERGFNLYILTIDSKDGKF